MIQKPKGTYDVLGLKSNKLLYIERVLHDVMAINNYEYMRTPIFESSELFHRGVGEGSDIVRKETYDFKDRADRDMTLRPEGTAGIVRSFIENKLYGNAHYPIKTWYYGPMYRYERPQSGRFREFYQFGVEVFGVDTPLIDADVINTAYQVFNLLNIENISIRINSIGNKETKEKYAEALKKHFEKHLDTLCPDCQERYNKNPLRILDCKVDKQHVAFNDIPSLLDSLTKEDLNNFEELQKILTKLGIPYTVDPTLVRGLDYYTNVVFEIDYLGEELGANNTVCAGGRYNNLVESLGGPSTPGVGFAIGIERLMSIIEDEGYEQELDAYVIMENNDANHTALAICQLLRIYGYKTDIDYLNRSVKSNYKYIDSKNTKITIIVKKEEVDNGMITVKNNITKTEVVIPIESIIDELDKAITEEHDNCCHSHSFECDDHNCSCEECECDECSCEECECDDCSCEECECDDCSCGYYECEESK